MMEASVQKDAGFAWIVLIASFMGHFFQYGIVWTVGYFYVIFLEHFEGSKAAVALIASLNTATYYCIGPLAGVLINLYGCRKIAFIGSVVGATGIVLSSFATTLYQLYVTFGFMTGCGLGLAYIPCISSVSFYFERHKSLAFGIATSGVGAGTLIFPLMLDWLKKTYGWRGAMLITGGICFNQCLCAMAFRCVSSEKKSTQPLNNNHNDKKELCFELEKVENRKRTMTSILHKLRTNMNVHILKNTGYLFLHLNSILVMFSTVLVYVHFGAYAVSVGYDDTTAAALFATMGISNFIGRFIYGGLGHVKGFSAIGLYTAGFLVSSLVIVLIPCAKTFVTLMLCSCSFGLATACNGSKMPQVLITVLGSDIDVFTSAFGYLLISCAIGALAGGPVAGWIYDTWKYYPSSFYVGGIAMFLSCVIMIWPWYQNKRNQKLHTKMDLSTIEKELKAHVPTESSITTGRAKIKIAKSTCDSE